MTALTPNAVEHEPLLRLVAAGDIDNVTDLARGLDRDPENTRKTVKKLREQGFIDDDALTLTGPGVRVLQAIDFADGALQIGREIAVRHAEMAPHPANPRHMIDDEVTHALAEAIAAVGGVQQPLFVTPPDEAGQRHILAGQRRWLAVGMLIAEDRWPAEKPLPAVEHLINDDADVIYAGLVENTGEPLKELDEARALKALCDQRGWSASECARKTGRLIRTVQHRLQILEKAAPEDLAAVERGEMTYRDLRDNVQTHKPKPALDLTPKLALLMMELADAALYRTGDVSGWVACKPEAGGSLGTLKDRRMIEAKGGRDGSQSLRLTPNPALTTWLAEVGFDEDRQGAVYAIRAEVLGPLIAESHAQSGQYATAWLNNAPVSLAPAAANPVRDEGEDDEEDADDPLMLAPDEEVVMLEVLHALEHRGFTAPGRDWACVRCDGFPGDKASSALIRDRGLLKVFQPAGSYWAVYLTAAGEAWRDVVGTDPHDLAAIHATGLRPRDGDEYITPWLNPPRKAPDQPATATAAAVETTPGASAKPRTFVEQLREVIADQETGDTPTFRPLTLIGLEIAVVKHAVTEVFDDQEIADFAQMNDFDVSDVAAIVGRIKAIQS